ncbi:MAG TPA: hypothetical protein VM095_04465 [Pyrinomonadaceae bacterium]|nr:hypothetical protein [Pyrinomonadaceae bacterium]
MLQQETRKAYRVHYAGRNRAFGLQQPPFPRLPTLTRHQAQRVA